MATKFISKLNWRYQYVVNDTGDFYRAFKDDPDLTISATAITEDASQTRSGLVKTVFPGGNLTATTPMY